MYRAALAFLFTTSACATTQLTIAETKDCESFAEVDAKVRAELDRLLAEAPGEVLVKETSRLNLARRACAKHRLSLLREVRERDGIEVVQNELDALSRTYKPEDLQLLITEQLGPEGDQLTPLLAEAKQRTTRESATKRNDSRDDAALKNLAVDGPSRMGPEPTAPDTLCDAPTPCAQLECIAAEAGNTDRAARACLDSLDRSDAAKEARAISRILSLLPPGISGTRTEANLRLEALRQLEWPKVQAERTANHRARAAELATPFSSIPSLTNDISAFRDAAQAHHLARAKATQQWPDAQWLHARIAETFGGPSFDPPKREGKWESVRWRCTDEQPQLPSLPVGLSATLTVRCERAPAKPAQEDGDLMRTFELEKQMRAARVMGSLNVLCADRSSLFTINADDGASVPAEIARTLENAIAACVKIHQLAATRSCTELRKRPPAEVTARFVDHARFNQKWEPCFVEWLAAEEGASPPAPPPIPHGDVPDK
ncbi:MAG: hypothetical protein QM817_36500 [Archangium sp.]